MTAFADSSALVKLYVPEGDEAYLEDGVIDEARERLGVPVVAAELPR